MKPKILLALIAAAVLNFSASVFAFALPASLASKIATDETPKGEENTVYLQFSPDDKNEKKEDADQPDPFADSTQNPETSPETTKESDPFADKNKQGVGETAKNEADNPFAASPNLLKKAESKAHKLLAHNPRKRLRSREAKSSKSRRKRQKTSSFGADIWKISCWVIRKLRASGCSITTNCASNSLLRQKKTTRKLRSSI